MQKISMSWKNQTLKWRRRGFSGALEIQRNSGGGEDFRYLSLLRFCVCSFCSMLFVTHFDFSSTNSDFRWEILGSFLIVWTLMICLVVFLTESRYRRCSLHQSLDTRILQPRYLGLGLLYVLCAGKVDRIIPLDFNSTQIWWGPRCESLKLLRATLFLSVVSEHFS